MYIHTAVCWASQLGAHAHLHFPTSAPVFQGSSEVQITIGCFKFREGGGKIENNRRFIEVFFRTFLQNAMAAGTKKAVCKGGFYIHVKLQICAFLKACLTSSVSICSPNVILILYLVSFFQFCFCLFVCLSHLNEKGFFFLLPTPSKTGAVSDWWRGLIDVLAF